MSYTYDGLYRLTEENITDPVLGNEVISYTYDNFGNRLEKTDPSGTVSYSYDDNDRLISEGNVTYTYDDNGNMLTKSDGTDTIFYNYDYENRLVFMQGPDGTTEYAYDADGIRVRSVADGVVTNYLVDRNRAYAQVLEEKTVDGNLVVSYVYGDDLISQKRGGSVSYYHYDGLGSTRALTDASANVTDTYVYEAFGDLIDHIGNTPNNYLFTGEQYDPNAGFYYLRARYYNTGSGRFLTQDPWHGGISDPVTLHKYIYANANPIRYIDPSGYFSLTQLGETTELINIISRTVRVFDTGFRVYNSASSVRNVLEASRLASDMVNALAQPTSGGASAALAAEVREALGNANVSGFNAVFDSLRNDWDSISKAVISKAPEIAAHVAGEVRRRMGSYMKAAAQGRMRIVLFMPTGPGPRSRDTYVKVGTDYELGLGATGGRLFGIGIRTSRNNVDQPFRIDYWDVRAGVENPYIHYHIYSSKRHYEIWKP